LSFGLDVTTNIREALSQAFSENDLELSFRCVNNTELGTCLEFLDVEHKIDNSSVCGFYTRDFVKPTAVNHSFLNGRSFHPPDIFKSIVFCEAVHLRRLNESQSEYLNNLNRLRTKCAQSNFNSEMVNDIVQLASTWTERFGPNNEKEEDNHNERIVWVSSFINLVKLDNRETNLVSKATVVYKRPPALLPFLNNYKKIAHNDTNLTNDNFGSSHACDKCALCGNFQNYIEKSMVDTINSIETIQEKRIHLWQNLSCTNFGIYAAQCTICRSIYVGQTKNRFFTRWFGHRTFCNSNNTIDNLNDRAALLIHYHTYQKEEMKSLADISKFFVIFLQQPSDFGKLDTLESKWINLLQAEININKTVLPKYH